MLNYKNPTEPTEKSPYEPLAKAIKRTRSDRKPASENLKDFILSFARKIDKEDDRAENIRIQSMVSMCRRHRGATPGDRFGIFNEQGTLWLEHPSFADLHGTNIFQSLVRGAEANYVQASVKLNIKATGNNFESGSVEKIANGVYEILRRNTWNETIEQQMFYAMILKLNGFIISRFNPGKGNSQLKMPKFGEQEYETSGLYICPECQTSGEFSTETGEKCQNCGNEDNLTLVDEPETRKEEVVDGYEDENAGEVETIIADGFDCRFDDSLGNCADISRSQWFEYHYLADKEELKRLYPDLKNLDRSPTWTTPTQWKMSLKKYTASASTPMTEWDKRQHEVREIYLEPNIYADYVSPESTKIGDYTIKRNGSLMDDFPDGLLAIVINDEVACLHPGSFKDVVKTAVWLADPMSGWGLGARAGLPIQKKINHLDNMTMEGIDRALRGALIYDPQAISGASLEGANTNIPLRGDFERNGAPIADFFAPLNVNGMSQDVMLFLSTQHDLIQKVMGVPDAAIGETNDNNRTATGQQLEANKATGLLIPAKRSQARAMEGWCLDQLKLIQKHYPAARLRSEFGSRYGEDWLDEEIEVFLDANLETDIIIEFAEGSEVPQTRAEKEAKLGMLISSGMIPPTPENLNKLIGHTGIEGIDIGEYESNIKVAQKRFTFVYETYKAQAEQLDAMWQSGEMQTLDPNTGQKLVDPNTGQPVSNPILAQFLQSPDMEMVEEAEDHTIQGAFWASKVREFLSMAKPASPVLIAVARQMIRQHQQAGVMQATKAQTLAGLTQMPGAMMQQQVQQGMESERQQEVAGQQELSKQQEVAGQQAQAEQQRQTELENKAIDHHHEAEMASAASKTPQKKA